MAGTLVISTLSDGTNSTSSTNSIRGSAKAWVSGNGSTAVIVSSYNVSSITRTSTGIYQINFTTAFPSSAYSYASGVPIDNSSASFFSGRYTGGTTSGSTFCYGIYRNTSGFWDNDINIAFFQ